VIMDKNKKCGTIRFIDTVRSIRRKWDRSPVMKVHKDKKKEADKRKCRGKMKGEE